MAGREAPELAASLASKAVFGYVYELVKRGSKAPLEAGDLWRLPPREAAAGLVSSFLAICGLQAAAAQAAPAATKQQKKSRFPPLLRSLVLLVKRELILSALAQLVYLASQLAVPVLLRALLNNLASPDAIGYAIGLPAVSFVGSVANQHQIHLALRIGQRLRSAMLAAVSRKAVAGGAASSGGKTINLVSSDAQRFLDVMPLLHQLWAAPLLIVIVTAVMLSFVGVSALAGIACLVLMIPLSSAIIKRGAAARKPHMKASDVRVKTCRELVTGVRVIKAMAWDLPFLSRIMAQRGEETPHIYTEANVFAANIVVLLTIPTWACITLFGVRSSMGYALDPASTMSVLAFLNVVRFPLNNLSTVLGSMTQLWISIERLNSYLGVQDGDSIAALAAFSGGDAAAAAGVVPLALASASEAVGTAPVAVEAAPVATPASSETAASSASAALVEALPSPPAPLISLRGASFMWGGGATPSSSPSFPAAPDVPEARAFALRDLDVQVAPGELLLVVGPISSGKTSFLHALLGEMRRVSAPASTALWYDRTAFAAQSPWILNASLRDNVLFDRVAEGAGEELEPSLASLYHASLRDCCLLPDIATLAGGERCFIGERGVTLSGGQRARVGLARCCVSGARLALLDDVCSALDVDTQRRVFHSVVGPRGLLASQGVTRVLVTHAIQFLGCADKILVLHQGRQAFCGSYAELLARGKAAASSVAASPALSAASGVDGSALPPLPPLPPAGLGLARRSTSLSTAPGADQHQQQRSREPSVVSEVDLADYEAPEPVARAMLGARYDDADKGWSSGAAVLLASLVAAAPMQDDGTGGSNGMEALAQQSAADAAAGGSTSKSAPATPRADGSAPGGGVAEERATGTVPFRVYLAWLKASGGWPLLLVLFVGFIGERVSYIAADVFLAAWTAARPGVAPTGLAALLPQGLLPPSDANTRISVWLTGYALIGVVFTVFACIRMFTFARVGSNAAVGLFKRMVWSIARAPLSWYESTPSGRIMNRLSTDTDVVDSVLLQKLTAAVSSTFWIASGVAVMVGVVPWMALVLLPVLLAYSKIHSIFRRTTRELSRLDSLSKSPILSHLEAMIAGAVTIRAFRATRRFVAKADALVDTNCQATLCFNTTTRWLSVMLEVLGCVATLSVALLAYGLASIAPGYAGLAILWSQSIVVSFNFNVLNMSEAEARMVSVERILQYTQLAPEAPLFKTPAKVAAAAGEEGGSKKAAGAGDVELALEDEPPTAPLPHPSETYEEAKAAYAARAALTAAAPGGAAPWPTSGAVSFRDVWLRYRPGLPPALRGLSLDIAGGEFVALVGRTGSGKSTTASGLFRLTEIARGSILVDGVDIATLPLADVRGAGMVFVPQEICLFGGTVRSSVDPLDQASDSEIWAALEAVQLAATVRAMPGQLAAPVAEDSLSHGEKQVLGLVRALLRRPKLVLLDEASSSVDARTEALISSSLRKWFKGTVIAIAHRLTTVLSADRVIVLDSGRAVESGSPVELLATRTAATSEFCKLVEAAGPAVEAEMLALAGVKREPAA